TPRLALPGARSRRATESRMTDHHNTIVAIVLSVMVLIAWQFFVGIPQMEKQQAQQEAQQQQTQQTQSPDSAPAPTQPVPGAAPTPGAPATRPGTAPREQVLAASPRIQIDTPRLRGSI